MALDFRGGALRPVAWCPELRHPRDIHAPEAGRPARRPRPIGLGELSARPTANGMLREAFLAGRDVAAPVGAFVQGALPARLARVIDAGAKAAGAAQVLACPLRSGRKVWGALLFHSAEPADRDWMRACAAFSLEAAATVAYARRLHEAKRRLAAARRQALRLAAQQDRQRRQAAEHLHGRVQAGLFAVERTLRVCEERLISDPRGAAELLAHARASLEQVRERDIRRASHALYPALLALGIVPALRTLGDRWHPHLEVSVQAADEVAALDGPLGGQPMPVRMALYLAAEEALTNAVRHGGATRAEVSVVVEQVAATQRDGTVLRGKPAGEPRSRLARGGGAGGAQLVLRVTDDGRTPMRIRPGVGLTAVAARVEGLGGTLRVVRLAEGGARVTAAIPL